MNKHHKINGLIVLGGGNHPENGISSSTHNTALEAAQLAQELQPSVVITSGYGPYEQHDYKMPESKHIAEVIGIYNQGLPIYEEPKSTTTFENFKNIRKIFESADLHNSDLTNWLIIAGPGHAKRASRIARVALGQELMIFNHETKEILAPKDILREKVQYALTSLALAGAKPGDYGSFLVAEERYLKAISPLKGSAVLSKHHHGRK